MVVEKAQLSAGSDINAVYLFYIYIANYMHILFAMCNFGNLYVALELAS